MSETRELVRRYHERFHPDQHEATPLTIPPELLAFRRRLHDEEVLEVAEAWNDVEARMGSISKRLANDFGHLLHELADLVIVAYGTASFLGVDLEDVVKIVMAANMRKIPNPDPTGKALKPPGFVSANLAVREYVRVRTMTIERCKHELPVGQCDYCRPKPPADPFGQPPRQSDKPGPVFIAAFTSECPRCCLDVETDDEARMYLGHAHHPGCAEAEWVDENTH
jgi:predicted HAD superfamily Cof-like phosphohydrolase